MKVVQVQAVEGVRQSDASLMYGGGALVVVVVVGLYRVMLQVIAVIRQWLD